MMFRKSWRVKSRKELETQVKKQRNALILTTSSYILVIVFLLFALQNESAQYDKMTNTVTYSIAELDKCHSLVSNISGDYVTAGNECHNHIKGLLDELNQTSYNYEKYFDKYMDCDIKLSEQDSYISNMPFIKPLQEFSMSHEYSLHNFNCVDFSNGAIEILSEMGYGSYVRLVRVNCSSGMFGCPMGNNRHAIVMLELPIEATGNFKIIPPDEFPDYGLAG